MLTAKALKCVVVLNSEEVAALVPASTSRMVLEISVDGVKYVSDIATKALRKAQATISEHGAANVAVFIQGKLSGSAIVDAGLVAQPKTPVVSTAPQR